MSLDWKKFAAVVVIIAIFAIVAIVLLRDFGGPEMVLRHTYAESSHMVLAGNLTYPGFYAWQMELERGEHVELTVSASHAVNLYVVPDSAHQTWANTYYHTTNPGLYYPSDQAITHSGQTLSTTLVFTVPADGTYDLVALNTFPTVVTVTMSGKVYGPG